MDALEPDTQAPAMDVSTALETCTFACEPQPDGSAAAEGDLSCSRDDGKPFDAACAASTHKKRRRDGADEHVEHTDLVDSRSDEHERSERTDSEATALQREATCEAGDFSLAAAPRSRQHWQTHTQAQEQHQTVRRRRGAGRARSRVRRAPSAADSFGGRRFATASTDAMGAGAESAFERACRWVGCAVRPASRGEDRLQHFDFHVWSPERVHAAWAHAWRATAARVEVRAIKAAHRGGAPDPTLIFVELTSVGGHCGWARGSADLVAFEQDYGFLVIPRTTLLSVAEHVAATAPRAACSGYKDTLYGRPGRDDLVVLLDRDRLVWSLGDHVAWLPKCA